MKGERLGKLLLSLLLLLLAGAAGITRFPDAPAVRQASEWPLLGPWIDRFAGLYRQSARARDRVRAREGDGDTVEVVYEFDVESFEARPRVWATPGTVFFREPAESADRLAIIDSYTNLLMFERRDDWYRVRYGDRKGWLHLPDPPESGEPPLGSEPAPVVPVPSRPPAPEVLAAALEMLEGPIESRRLGAHDFYTDLGDPDLLAFLGRVAEQLEPAYRRRYGVVPLAGAEEAVVLYRTREQYRRYKQSVPGIADLDAPGVVHEGVVASYAQGRERAEIANTLIHELTHLLNRRAVGPALPPWLEEGLADDMGQSRIDAAGTITPGEVGGSFRRSGVEMVWRGGRASAIELDRALDAGRLPSIEVLVGLDWRQFQAGPERPLRYSQSSFLIRSLLDSPDPRLAEGFRQFLSDVAGGRPLTPERLRERLGRTWSSLDARLASFVRLQAIDEGAPTGADSGSSSRQAKEPSS